MFWGMHKTFASENLSAVIKAKARAITSGETPQKSLILPPVHTAIKGLVAPVNLIFSYF